MRNVWKGLMVGGFTGVAAGVLLDVASGTSKQAHVVGDKALEHAPDAAEWLRSSAKEAKEKIASNAKQAGRKAAEKADETGKRLVTSAKEKADSLHS